MYLHKDGNRALNTSTPTSVAPWLAFRSSSSRMPSLSCKAASLSRASMIIPSSLKYNSTQFHHHDWINYCYFFPHYSLRTVTSSATAIIKRVPTLLVRKAIYKKLRAKRTRSLIRMPSKLPSPSTTPRAR